MLPPVLRGKHKVGELLAADSRRAMDGFRQALLKIVAGLIDVNPGSLLDRDRARNRALLLQRVTATTLVASLVFVGACWMLVNQFRERSATLLDLAQAANEAGQYDRALRFGVSAMRVSDAAEVEVIRALVNNRLDVVLQGHQGIVDSVQFNSDGTLLVTASESEGSVRIWEAVSGRELVQRRLNLPRVAWADFDRNGRVVTLVRSGNPMTGLHEIYQTWDSSNRVVDTADAAPPRADLREVSVAGDGDAYRPSLPVSVASWMRRTGRTGGILSPSGQLLCIWGSLQPEILDARSGETLVRIPGDGRCTHFSADEAHVAIYGSGVWDIRTRTLVTPIAPSTAPTRYNTLSARSHRNVDFSPSGDRIAVADYETVARVFRIEGDFDPTPMAETSPTLMQLTMIRVDGVLQTVPASLTPDRRLAAVVYGGTRTGGVITAASALVVDVSTGDVIWRAIGHSAAPDMAVFDSVGRHVITSSGDLPYLTGARWTARPTARDFERLYPGAALQAGVQARVTLDCSIEPTGALDCTVENVEASENAEEFGDASLQLAQHFMMAPTLAGGTPTAGRRYRLNLRWNLLGQH